MWHDHGGREVTYIFTKIKSVQNEVFVYYFEGKNYECLENKIMPPNDSANIYNLSNSFENIIKDVYFIYEWVYIFINCQK